MVYSTKTHKLFPTILRLLAIGVVGGNMFFLLYYMLDLPPIIMIPSDLPNVPPDALYIIRDPVKDPPDLNQVNQPSQPNTTTNNNNNTLITLQNRFIRRPPSKNCILPPGFPEGAPGWKRLVRICNHLDKFSVPCLPNQTCIECIPPWGHTLAAWITEFTTKFIKGEYETRIQRRAELQNIITNNLQLQHDESSILLITLNSGYIYMFSNWLCGLHLLGIAEDIRSTTIIIATDKKTETFASNVGFQTVRGDWFDVKIDEAAAKSFALGAHRWAVSLQIVYAADLIHLGYNVLQQDSDVVWLRDVRKYFENTYNDIEMACDGRLDDIGPANSGFIHIRSNCKTKVYMDTLVYYIGLVIASRSDQRHWNMFLMSYDFRQMLFEMLPPDIFVGGYQWGKSRSKYDQLLSDHIWMFHASWTFDHTEKISKFKQVGAWFFNASCPFYVDGMTPNHSEPEYYSPVEGRKWKWPDKNGKTWWRTHGQKHYFEKRRRLLH